MKLIDSCVPQEGHEPDVAVIDGALDALVFRRLQEVFAQVLGIGHRGTSLKRNRRPPLGLPQGPRHRVPGEGGFL